METNYRVSIQDIKLHLYIDDPISVLILTSNAMKMKIEGKDFDRKLIEKFEGIDSNSQRRNTIVQLISSNIIPRFLTGGRKTIGKL